MSVRYTGHHIKITSNLRSHMDTKVPRIEKLVDRVQSIEFVVEKEAHQVLAEIHVRAGTLAVTGKQRDPEAKRAIDLAMDKVEVQLRKKVAKLRGNMKSVTEANRNAKKADLDNPEPGLDARPMGRVAAVKPSKARKAGGRATNEAAGARRSGNGNGRLLPITLDKFNIHVFPSQRHDIGRMSVEEAAEELFFKDENFLCFVNAETGTMNVVYRRKDGNFAVIEPGNSQA